MGYLCACPMNIIAYIHTHTQTHICIAIPVSKLVRTIQNMVVIADVALKDIVGGTVDASAAMPVKLDVFVSATTVEPL